MYCIERFRVMLINYPGKLCKALPSLHSMYRRSACVLLVCDTGQARVKGLGDIGAPKPGCVWLLCLGCRSEPLQLAR